MTERLNWQLGRLLDQALNRCKVMEACMERKENYLLEERRKRRNTERLLKESEELCDRRGRKLHKLRQQLK